MAIMLAPETTDTIHTSFDYASHSPELRDARLRQGIIMPSISVSATLRKTLGDIYPKTGTGLSISDSNLSWGADALSIQEPIICELDLADESQRNSKVHVLSKEEELGQPITIGMGIDPNSIDNPIALDRYNLALYLGINAANRMLQNTPAQKDSKNTIKNDIKNSYSMQFILALAGFFGATTSIGMEAGIKVSQGDKGGYFLALYGVSTSLAAAVTCPRALIHNERYQFKRQGLSGRSLVKQLAVTNPILVTNFTSQR